MWNLICKLDRVSLIMWISCDKSFDDVSSCEEFDNGLVKVWFKDGSMVNLVKE
jgi:hypothetical protein